MKNPKHPGRPPGQGPKRKTVSFRLRESLYDRAQELLELDYRKTGVRATATEVVEEALEKLVKRLEAKHPEDNK